MNPLLVHHPVPSGRSAHRPSARVFAVGGGCSCSLLRTAPNPPLLVRSPRERVGVHGGCGTSSRLSTWSPTGIHRFIHMAAEAADGQWWSVRGRREPLGASGEVPGGRSVADGGPVRELVSSVRVGNDTPLWVACGEPVGRCRWWSVGHAEVVAGAAVQDDERRAATQRQPARLGVRALRTSILRPVHRAVDGSCPAGRRAPR